MDVDQFDPQNNQSVPYYGQSILPEDSFLRVLPHIVDNKTRISIDAIVMSCDIMTESFNRIREMSINRGLNGGDVDNRQIASIFGYCWAIVDQMHCVSQLVYTIHKKHSERGPLTRSMITHCEVATTMRNAMDHLKDNLGNLSERKGQRSPLFGSLSYFYAANLPDHSGNGVTLVSGSQVDELRFPLINPIERPFVLPVGLFDFTAFERTLQIEPALDALSRYVVAMGSDIEKQVIAAATQHANETGVDVESLLVSGRGSMTIVTHFGPSSADS